MAGRRGGFRREMQRQPSINGNAAEIASWCLTRAYPRSAPAWRSPVWPPKPLKNWQECTDSNRGPSVLETDALPTELHSCGRASP